MATMEIKHKWNSLKTHIWLSFLLIFTTILSCVWVLQIVLYDKIYELIKTQEITNLTSELVDAYNASEFTTFLDKSNATNSNIIVFTIRDSAVKIEYSTARESNIDKINQNIDKLLSVMQGATRAKFVDSTAKEQKILICGVKTTVNPIPVFFYVDGIITPLDSTSDVLTKLFGVITLISLIATIIIAVILTNTIAKPIELLSKRAEKLSAGDLTVKFDAGGYSEVQKLSNTLNYSIQEVKKSQDLQKEVIQNVSHELRTPLTMIKAYAELMLDYSGENPEKRTEHLNIILNESAKLEMLVSDLLDLSKLQSKTMHYVMSHFNLADSLEKFEEYYRSHYGEKGYEFKFSFPKEISIFADKMRIEQAISNLINNAINYSQDRKQIKVLLKYLAEKNTYRLEITDSGMGIKESDLPHIFDRHFRSFSGKRAVAGSGIGLSIVKEILDYHKFNFGVQSKENQGATFFIEFEKSAPKVKKRRIKKSNK